MGLLEFLITFTWSQGWIGHLAYRAFARWAAVVLGRAGRPVRKYRGPAESYHRMAHKSGTAAHWSIFYPDTGLAQSTEREGGGGGFTHETSV